MKAIKYLILGMILGGALGFAAGMNIGKDKPLLSNPFARYELSDRLKDSGSDLMKKSGEALEDTGKAIQKSFE